MPACRWRPRRRSRNRRRHPRVPPRARRRRVGATTSSRARTGPRHRGPRSAARGRRAATAVPRAHFAITLSRSRSTIAGGSRSTPPRSRNSTAASSRSNPTTECASSAPQVPPNSATSACSLAIQYGSESTIVPSMSMSRAAGRVTGGVCQQNGRDSRGAPQAQKRRRAQRALERPGRVGGSTSAGRR